ncbi:hypothetical protein GCM10007918_28520 [Piscinibacter gummiphilus]|nr:hypothetical protein GCM10007918_28520 [Piscinibacter gummiphilus]
MSQRDGAERDPVELATACGVSLLKVTSTMLSTIVGTPTAHINTLRMRTPESLLRARHASWESDQRPEDRSPQPCATVPTNASALRTFWYRAESAPSPAGGMPQVGRTEISLGCSL